MPGELHCESFFERRRDKGIYNVTFLWNMSSYCMYCTFRKNKKIKHSFFNVTSKLLTEFQIKSWNIKRIRKGHSTEAKKLNIAAHFSKQLSRHEHGFPSQSSWSIIYALVFVIFSKYHCAYWYWRQFPRPANDSQIKYIPSLTTTR